MMVVVVPDATLQSVLVADVCKMVVVPTCAFLFLLCLLPIDRVAGMPDDHNTTYATHRLETSYFHFH